MNSESCIKIKNDERYDFCKSCKNYFLEFCGSTSIHGFKFLGERNNSLIEKIWWLIVITISLVSGTICIMKTYSKWTTSPVIVSFATSQTSIRDIPFPAVTICPDVKSKKNKFEFSKIHDKLKNSEHVAEEELKQFQYLNMICQRSERYPSFQNKSLKIVNNDAIDFITSVAVPPSDIFETIDWKGFRYSDSKNFFIPILNDEGVCYTFNILDKKDLFTDVVIQYKQFYKNGNVSNWSIENGFVNKSSLEHYPRNSLVSGTEGGIDIILKTSEDDIDYICDPDFVGFKMSLQHPGLIPRVKKQYYSIPLDQNVLASVKPIMMRTSKSLINADPNIRQCYFATEKKLMFYNQYNQPNCLYECLTNYTLETCGCVAFYMPRSSATPICGPGKNKCIAHAKTSYISYNEEGADDAKSSKTDCNCLPSCSSLDFEVSLSQSNWNWEFCLNYNNTRPLGKHYSRLKIFFKDMQFTTSVRNELYSTTDFIANCGGLLGLFMGFSTVSMFEILYYVSLKLFCNFRKRKDMCLEIHELHQVKCEK